MNYTIVLGDGSHLAAGLAGPSSGKVIMLPNAKQPVYGQEAEQLKLWGVDPELGKHLVEGLTDTFRVLYFDYEGHLFRHPRPDHLTPEEMVQDFLLIADEMGVERFSYYGYSWLALAGLQLAIRTDRLESLIMGGYPPYAGPYLEMLTVTEKTYEQALDNQNAGSTPRPEAMNPEDIDWNNIEVTIDPGQTKQFYTLYKSLMDFDDRTVQSRLQIPKLAFAGEQDTITYGQNFGGAVVDIAGLLKQHEPVLKSYGWDVELIKGADMDHTKAMQPETVLPLIRPWLISKLKPADS